MLFWGVFQRVIGRRWFSQWEEKYTLAEQELSILPQILKKDSIIFDIGANRGELSFFFAVNCHAKKVFSFEPQSRVFGILRGVAENTKNIVPINVALSDSTKEKILRIPIKTTGRYTPAASFEQLYENNLKEEKVEVETVDNFVVKNNITRLDFIKCDTEGHELAVFKGADKTLVTLRPLLYIEIKDANKRLLFELLKDKEYRPYRWDNETSCLVALTGTQNIQSENYYFFPIEKKEWIIKILKSS
jgi:FkbM family methyltransferase